MDAVTVLDVQQTVGTGACHLVMEDVTLLVQMVVPEVVQMDAEVA